LRYAFLLLKYRQRSESEMRRRLIAKRFEPDVTAQVLERLKQGRYLDDAAYARALVKELQEKPLGAARIRQKLMQRGFPLALIKECLAAAQEGYDERAAVREIAQRRLKLLAVDEPEAARRKLYGYLARRGFSPDAIQECMESL
jgi:regulatory protein